MRTSRKEILVVSAVKTLLITYFLWLGGLGLWRVLLYTLIVFAVELGVDGFLYCIRAFVGECD